MVLTCRRIQLFVRESKAEFFQYPARGCVRWMVTGKKSIRVQRVEGVRDDRACCFFGQTLVPMPRAEVKAEFVDFFFHFVRPQAGAAREIVTSQQEYGPILDTMRGHRKDFFIEPRFDLILRKRPADPACDCSVAPKSLGERQIIRGPIPKTEASCAEKIWC